MKNNNLYNDKELNDDADLNWYDYGFRSYDPQIGRFPQLDPLTDDYPELTPYQYGSNDPIANIDVDGLEGFNAVQTLDAVIIKSGGHAAATALSVSGSFLKGVGSSLWGAVTGIASAVAHPISTITGLAHVVAHPIQTAKALGNVLSNTYDEFKNGNGNVKAGILGHAVGDIAQLFIGTGEAKAATETLEIANILEKGAKIAEEARTLGKTATALEEGYETFNAFKKANGSAGKGYAWHHIVEQNPSNIEKFGNRAIHTESNLVKLPHGKETLHSKVSGYYSRKAPFTKGRVRDVVNKMSYEDQYNHGVEILKKFGWKQ